MIDYILYGLFCLAFFISLIAEARVFFAFRKYSQREAASGRRAEEIVEEMLLSAGVRGVRIERVRGHMTDHYDPKARVLRLSDSVYGERSVAAVGVAAHEAGHAIQHAEGYAPLRLRTKMVPITGFASRAAWILILLGSLLMSFAALGYYFMMVGVALFSVTTLFQLVTLPCEMDASKRALAAMEGMGYYSSRELGESKKVLSAAAMTYVAGIVVSMIQLLRFVIILRGND